MKVERKIVLFSAALGAFVWVADSFLDYFFFYEGTLIELLITDVPSHELYIRILIMVCFVIFGLVCAHLIGNLKKSEGKLSSALNFQQQLLNTIPVPVFYKDENYIYTGCNKSFEDFLSLASGEIIGKSVYDLAPVELAEGYHEKDAELINNPGVQVYDFEVQSKSKGKRQVVFHKATFHNQSGEIAGLIGVILDITARKEVEDKKAALITELQEALDKVKLLSGFLPICASCKKIRDDKGYWKQIESYIRDHSEVEFSHGICPECAKELYKDIDMDSA